MRSLIHNGKEPRQWERAKATSNQRSTKPQTDDGTAASPWASKPTEAQTDDTAKQKHSPNSNKKLRTLRNNETPDEAPKQAKSPPSKNG